MQITEALGRSSRYTLLCHCALRDIILLTCLQDAEELFQLLISMISLEWAKCSENRKAAHLSLFSCKRAGHSMESRKHPSKTSAAASVSNYINSNKGQRRENVIASVDHLLKLSSATPFHGLLGR